MITPLRDGMNTTSMEFVIAQNEKTKNQGTPKDRGPSPLVLSEFMGISKHMEEALLVNPWDLGVSLSSRSVKAVDLCPIGPVRLRSADNRVSNVSTLFLHIGSCCRYQPRVAYVPCRESRSPCETI